ncbi:inhibitor of nuclear factor kappa-B kinase subunit epsilon isoform X1 [Alligator sinensis]|uniref:Serine/threonine-protein kinase TBK1 n=1 Tax=Alligator sinensis TaxID=38654 RepID=A0A1U8D6F4_ALLSI|nr:inhibitor of nuclear factor kappa-B kinase subunit epsilon isoform X1 [Alligator sinensis]XP_025061271.1 inhibitor of nuclear factor kappa-B kinase subunit epsilon isoform X1 [Alligator sinensis]XP_025061272.1 inhibitor of nuclear factor kappa-B kinase subunit epsilon isoform X1 [Alligator sinensis]XP_025061273.1 inhibitor of nuclear factor kappa-B kinase subunit epsilon isoform X1 [Alligator sinensis]XP_025061274.1 inhibitor of nuclear factor kappa-B kinase subunit epsilon isoform X1 [Allig
MQSTPNYLWYTDDVLGQGATACVYKARNKKSGELVAVKVFNNASYMRPQEVQLREFEVLRKLNHKNIVKLFAIEEAGSSKQKVLVMEYCSSGSLLNMLEDPENAFGLSEAEFLIVLNCVVAGMNHLRENGIVHRDIKPGNIMRLMGEDGQSVYKLTDFGAARELDDDEKFVSVYGTEEYLHPDMYERAVLRKPQQKAYGVTVDLWSIGVTFYHAAAGSLPFIPFGGPRRNKEIMYKITTQKPSGAISGVQRQENGAIEWSYELPVTCRLSVGLKSQLVPILANILEVDQEKCWGFDQFFAETSDILQRIVFDVFSLSQATMHRVFIHSHNTTNIFLDAVFRQTNTAPHHQEYFFEGYPYDLEPNLQAQNFSRTTQNSPLTLLSTETEDPIGVRYRDPAHGFPKFVPKVDVIADCSIAKGVLGAVHQTLRIARSLLKCQEFILRGLHCVIESLKSECSKFLERKETAVLMLTCLQHTNEKTLMVYESVSGSNGNPELKDLAEVKARLQTVTEDLFRYSHSISEYQGTLGDILSELVNHRQQAQEDRSIRQMECCLEKMQLIHKQFKKARACMRLAYNEEQIHKLDKLNLGHLARKVISIFQDDCVQKYQDVLGGHGNRMRKVCEIKKHLKKLDSSLSAGCVELTECWDCLHNGEVPATTIISPHVVLLQHLPSHIPFKSSSFEGGRGVEYMALPRDVDLGAQHITCSSVKSLYLCRLWTGCHRESRSLPLLYQFTHKTPNRVWHLECRSFWSK